MTEQEMIARIAELERQVANKKTSARIKVSPKGAVSFYGVGRYPASYYVSQWEVIFAAVDELKAFIETNRALLSVKPEKSEETAVPATTV